MVPGFWWEQCRSFRVMSLVRDDRSPLARLRDRSASALMFVALMLIGCQSVAPTPLTLPPVEAPKSLAGPTVDPELIDQFATWLDQDAWQVDLQWSALTLDVKTLPRWRWVFLPAGKIKAPPKENTSVAKDETEAASITRWNAVWRGNAGAMEASERDTIRIALRELANHSPRVGANATILASRLESDDASADRISHLSNITGGSYPVTETRGDAIPPKRVTTATRAAAAEAWCAELRRTSPDDPVTALTPAGIELQRPGLPDEIRITLWRALAVSIPPDHIPQLSTTLSRKWDGTPTGETLKRAALEACIIHAIAHTDTLTEWDAALWPPQIEAVRYDNDARLRQLFGRWLAWSKHPQAAVWLAGQLRDTQPMVREVALHSLGELTTDAARQELLKTAQRETGRPRALAVQALAQHSVQDVLKFSRDPSGDVRSAVARSLVNHPSDETAIALRPFFSDTHPDVPETALTTIQAWPLEWRLPLLLDAVRSGSLMTRQTAVFALRDAIPDLPDLPIDGRPEERDQAVQQVAQAHQIRLDLWVTTSERHLAAMVTQADDEARAMVLREVLRQYLTAAPQTLEATESWDRLLQLATGTDLAAIEPVLIEEQGKPGVETIRKELLPRISPAYAALQDLESRDVNQRRRGARALFQSTEQKPLSSGLLMRLRELLTYEQDQQVWQVCLAALQPDAHTEAGPIVLLAINQMWPDIRRMGVEVVSRHPSPEAAVWLMPLLSDPQRSVRLAAIRAVAACGNPVAVTGLPAANGAPAVTGLRNIMTETYEELRLAAVVSSAVLHDEQAIQELTRLSQHATPSVRDFAAQAMARTGDPRFVDTLIRMAWTESADPVKLSILKSLDALTPVERRPAELVGLAVTASIDDKIKAWARWGDAQRRRAMIPVSNSVTP